MTRFLATAFVVGTIALPATTATAQDLQVSVGDGTVTILARNVSARQILDEWARVGQITVVDADTLAGPPLTLDLRDVPERRALESVLRGASGYLVTTRLASDASPSTLDRVKVLGTSNAPAAVATGGPGAFGAVGAQPYQAPEQQFVPSYDAPPLEAGEPASFPGGADSAPPMSPYVGAGFTAPAQDGTFDSEAPPETNFDYANPEQFLQMQGAQPGEVTPPSLFPGMPTGATGQPPPSQPFGVPTSPQSSPRPGEIIVPPAPGVVNPYGIPGNVQPGSQTPPPNLEPDRSKYLNPYAPTPPPPPPPVD